MAHHPIDTTPSKASLQSYPSTNGTAIQGAGNLTGIQGGGNVTGVHRPENSQQICGRRQEWEHANRQIY